MRYLFASLIALLLFAGCGKRGPLVPPEAFIPKPVDDLKVVQQGDNFLVSWTIPGSDEGGRTVRDLAGFRLLRRVVLPPDEDCEACSEAYRVVRIIDLDYLRDTRRLGNRLYMTDTGLETGITYQYKVVSFQKDGTPGHDSNKFRLIKLLPPPPPGLDGEATPTSIVLRWNPAIMPGNMKMKGYNIYKWRVEEPAAIVPINATPISATDFEDFRLERGVNYFYCIRSAGETDGISVESSSSNKVREALKEPE